MHVKDGTKAPLSLTFVLVWSLFSVLFCESLTPGITGCDGRLLNVNKQEKVRTWGVFLTGGQHGLPAASVVSGSGTLCASWQCLEVPRGPPPSLAVQFVGSGTSLSGMDVELVGSRYRMSLVKKRFATGKAAKNVRSACASLVSASVFTVLYLQ